MDESDLPRLSLPLCLRRYTMNQMVLRERSTHTHGTDREMHKMQSHTPTRERNNLIHFL